jgi:hypothetical protein
MLVEQPAERAYRDPPSLRRQQCRPTTLTTSGLDMPLRSCSTSKGARAIS